MNPRQYLINLRCADCGSRFYSWGVLPQHLYGDTELLGFCPLCEIVEDFAT